VRANAARQSYLEIFKLASQTNIISNFGKATLWEGHEFTRADEPLKGSDFSRCGSLCRIFATAQGLELKTSPARVPTPHVSERFSKNASTLARISSRLFDS
jgi:hypothetical protein